MGKAMLVMDMPEKSEVEDLPFRDGYKLGWNACIDKIMGEGETD